MSDVIIIPDEIVLSKIYQFRGKKVMIDADLAELYEVETRVLNQQIKRNMDRFPEDFMFTLNKEEWEQLKSQNTNSAWGGRRSLPNVFTEHGVLMLSSILNSKKAIATNIQIVRIFTRMREMLLTHKDILLQLEEIRKRSDEQDDRLDMIYNYLRRFMKEEKMPKRQLGYKK